MRKTAVYVLFVFLLLTACTQAEHKTVMCVPVYGQSLALGEEAALITDFDSLSERVVTENLDRRFGYYDVNKRKQTLKKLLHYQKRVFELSVYGMAEFLVGQLGNDTMVCIFPGGQGATPIAYLSKGQPPYERLLEDIRTAYNKAVDKEWDFQVPAVCWMQGESDLFDYTGVDYKAMLYQFQQDISRDIRSITHQKNDVRIVCYQTNLVSNAVHFQPMSYDCVETAVPQAMMELVRDDSMFWASAPTYPYSFARELKHIDGVSQKRLGFLAAQSVLGIIRGDRQRQQGLVPLTAVSEDTVICLRFSVPCPPLMLDTVLVKNPGHYGFSVITPQNEDILKTVSLSGDSIILTCSRPTSGCKVRYAVNGERLKSGWEKGPRGNLRDSQPAVTFIQGTAYPSHHWCYQFDLLLNP